MITLNQGITIPEKELRFETSRSSGPGGQHVNTSNTRVTVLFDLNASQVLEEEAKELIRRHLASRISKKGLIRVTSQRHRSQLKNRTEALERLRQLLNTALQSRPERRRTKVLPSQKEKRLEEKRYRSRIKKLRARPEEG